MERTLLTLGHGYSARVLARHLVERGWRVIGTTRTGEEAAKLADTGIEIHIWPGCELEPLLAQASHVLLSAGPDAEGDPFLPHVSDALCERPPQWLGYLSTVGVYGDHAGGWVDENAPLAPSTRRGKLRVEAEQAWQALAARCELPLHIFRLAGIYGPGRGPFAKLRAGTARRIIKPGQVFSRIHVEDIAQILIASMERPNPGAVYNVCDNEPAPPQDVIAHAAELLGLPVPPDTPFEAADFSPMARSFYAESKKVRNDRIREELGVALRYPDYRSGLAALLKAEEEQAER
ncbi:SDR family oxidoreductase [Aliiruegeria lutimaris]|uniref:Nucleoside-diphosphate-sugar epimerase n=1 Tax=Aliiruegeria lutimaris TaxID=571298 RepID=A0A1G8R830_9RHOB|nr:SDR family oxidoreductase [Aliiruegeria lutimaris]SDJ12695.1 Nucleoside-diphosphate-sugar epimerase [Aliiruegeria lutimaris]